MAFPETIDPTNELDRLQVAFGMFVARLIVDADGIVEFTELKLLHQAFPDDLLMSMGYLDDQGEFTHQYRDAYTEATRRLPHELDEEQKLALITLFHNTCMVDGSLVQAELLVLREASEILGLDVSTLSAHLVDLRDKENAQS